MCNTLYKTSSSSSNSSSSSDKEIEILTGVVQTFQTLNRSFPRVIGVINRSHISIRAPSKDNIDYLIEKNYSVILQAVYDSLEIEAQENNLELELTEVDIINGTERDLVADYIFSRRKKRLIYQDDSLEIEAQENNLELELTENELENELYDKN
ncbi:hypothetical protein Glove_402g4 [Diversispora epigaea]|uniref:Uncharacterized protein n=1 Tax=Diversispora epigaea TaxID=1348612 RepID=A0A397H4L4_9GLOM|nr:hypothetical protein Glove_402g4 [Diversispora epigaea]